MPGKDSNRCSDCGSTRLRSEVPVDKLGLHYRSGIVVRTKPLLCKVCLDCGKVEWLVEDPHTIGDKELVGSKRNSFLPFILFALFIMSLQLE